MPVEVPLVSICILCDVQLQLHLGLSHSILTDYILLLFLGYLSPACAFPSCPFIFPAGLDSVMQVFYIPDFLHLGRKIFGPLWKMSSKVYQLCSSPVFLRAVSQGVLLTCLNTWNFLSWNLGSWNYSSRDPSAWGLWILLMHCVQPRLSPTMHLCPGHSCWSPSDPVPHPLCLACLLVGQRCNPRWTSGVSSIPYSLLCHFPSR